jgi:hypothetical protein
MYATHLVGLVPQAPLVRLVQPDLLALVAVEMAKLVQLGQEEQPAYKDQLAFLEVIFLLGLLLMAWQHSHKE